MDTRLKNSRRIRTILAVLAILIVTIVNFFMFPVIGRVAEKEFQQMKQQEGIDGNYIYELMRGSYVLYYEQTKEEMEYPDMVGNVMNNWATNFEELRYGVDYYVKSGDLEQKNTSMELEAVIEGEDADIETMKILQESYQFFLAMNFNKDGELSVDYVWDMNGREDDLIKLVLKGFRQNDLISELYGYADGYMEMEEEYADEDYATDFPDAPEYVTDTEVGKQLTEAVEVAKAFPRNCQIVYAIPNDNMAYFGESVMDEYWGRLSCYSSYGSSILFSASLVVLTLVMFFLTSNTIWHKTIDFKRRGIWYVAEAAVIGIICALCMHDTLVSINCSYVTQYKYQIPLEVLGGGRAEQFMSILELALETAFIYALWYVCVRMIRPIFTLGPKEYIRQYSLIYLVCAKFVGWCKKYWNRTKEEVAHIDFSNKTIKTIRKIVIINFIVLAVLSCFWFFGIFALILYSVILFFVIKNQYYRVEQDYQSLKEATERIAQGDLQYEDTRDWGVFEPLKEEMTKIRSGFSKAVEEEVKSQRMKAELITNVSHDLKTPLTAITTYVELLKDENITEEQRKSYVEILEKKSLRLKVLVEDLFEVSKATSNTIQLDMMAVDVVNLLKQVCVEHESKFEEKGLEIKWRLPEEKIMLMLDNQKTYRIFENLFVNIEKYAMPNSRVFIDVTAGEKVQIVIRNMSAQELEVTGAEITERFVRGDASRTTEGSGLGLAIAKSFTEAQKGIFEVMVDGDLFKVVIQW